MPASLLPIEDVERPENKGDSGLRGPLRVSVFLIEVPKKFAEKIRRKHRACWLGHSGCWAKSLLCHRCSFWLPGEKPAERKAIKRLHGWRSSFHDQTNPSPYSLKVCRAQTTVPDQSGSSLLRATSSTQGCLLHPAQALPPSAPTGIPQHPVPSPWHLFNPICSFQGPICTRDHQQQTSDLV